MSIYTLGLNIYHADSSSCLMKNGRLICAYEEERLNRVKHWAGIPFKAISECLKHERINLSHSQMFYNHELAQDYQST